MDAEINNVICMELYSGAMMVDDKYLKTNNVRSIDRDSTVLHLNKIMTHRVFKNNLYGHGSVYLIQYTIQTEIQTPLSRSNHNRPGITCIIYLMEVKD
jgi:hypothetical protein